MPEFVTRLRAGVGHDLLWLPGVSGVVVDDDGRLLLGRRADNGRWAVLSGILDPGEQPAVGIAREILEESGVQVDVVALVSVMTGEPVHYPNGDAAQYLDLCFWCRPVAGEAHVADDESLEIGWFAPDALPADLVESSAERIRHALEHRAAHPHGGGAPVFVRP